MMETPQYRAIFKQFLEKNQCVEILHFLESVEGYQRVMDPDQRRQLAKSIFGTFITLTGPQPVNLDAKTRLGIEEAMKDEKQENGIDLFQKAHDHMYYLMV